MLGATAYGGYPQPYGQPMQYPPPYGGTGYMYPFPQAYGQLTLWNLTCVEIGIEFDFCIGYPPQIVGPGPPIQTTESGQGGYFEDFVSIYIRYKYVSFMI